MVPGRQCKFHKKYIAKVLYNILNCLSFLVTYKRGFSEFVILKNKNYALLLKFAPSEKINGEYFGWHDR